MDFDDRNLAAQCPSCNGGFGGKVRGNYHEYRVGLIARYGLPYVEAIEARRYDVIKHTVESLDILTATYRAKLAQAKEQAA